MSKCTSDFPPEIARTGETLLTFLVASVTNNALMRIIPTQRSPHLPKDIRFTVARPVIDWKSVPRKNSTGIDSKSPITEPITSATIYCRMYTSRILPEVKPWDFKTPRFTYSTSIEVEILWYMAIIAITSISITNAITTPEPVSDIIFV